MSKEIWIRKNKQKFDFPPITRTTWIFLPLAISYDKPNQVNLRLEL